MLKNNKNAKTLEGVHIHTHTSSLKEIKKYIKHIEPNSLCVFLI